MLTPNDMDRNENPGGIFWRNVIITRQTEAAPHKDQKLFNFNIIGLVSSPTPNQDVDLIGQDDNNTIRYDQAHFAAYWTPPLDEILQLDIFKVHFR